MIRRPVVLIFLLYCCVAAARTTLVVFPLVNESSDCLNDWVATALPESFSRILSPVEGIRVWDPVFMFQTDSAGWTMQSDSLLMVHHDRWGWNAAAGGTFLADDDSVTMRLSIVWVIGTRQHVKMKLEGRGAKADCAKLCAKLVLQCCSLLRLEIPHEDSLRIARGDVPVNNAYNTYCAGYRFEMAARYADAQTAYSRSAGLDPAFLLAQCRSGLIYLKSGNLERAGRIFKRVVNAKNATPAERAMAVDFVVERFRPDRASRIIDNVRGELEKSASGLTAIGRQYLTAGEYQRAIASLRRAVAWGPVDLDAEFLLGMAYLRSGEYDAAVDLLNRLVWMQPDHPRNSVALGSVYRESGRLMESLAVLEKAKIKHPENSMVLVELSHTCLALCWYRKAGQLLEEALRLKPGQVDIMMGLGIVYWHEKRHAEAQELFERAGREAGGEFPALANIGSIAFLSGDIDAAIKAYRRADRICGGKSSAVLYNLAIANLEKGDKKSAAGYLDRLLMLMPGRTDLLVGRARLAHELGDVENAQISYRRILENDPDHEVAIMGLVGLLMDQKRYKEAIFHIESHIEIVPARADLMLLLADAYRSEGWFEVAIEKYRNVMKLFPDYAAGYLGVGRCMYDMVMKKGSVQCDEALYALKQASGYAPDDPEPFVMMGDIYLDCKGYADMALEQWDKALARCKDNRLQRDIRMKIAAAGRR